VVFLIIWRLETVEILAKDSKMVYFRHQFERQAFAFDIEFIPRALFREVVRTPALSDGIIPRDHPDLVLLIAVTSWASKAAYQLSSGDLTKY
jgi:hypothetical protein